MQNGKRNCNECENNLGQNVYLKKKRKIVATPNYIRARCKRSCVDRCSTCAISITKSACSILIMCFRRLVPVLYECFFLFLLCLFVRFENILKRIFCSVLCLCIYIVPVLVLIFFLRCFTVQLMHLIRGVFNITPLQPHLKFKGNKI